MKRRKPMRRKAKKPADRELHDEDRKQYREAVGRCELCGTTAGYLTVHHIITKRKGTYEAIQNYITVCDIKGGPPQKCHAAAHQPGGRQRCIKVKLLKCEWFTREEEWELFMRYYTDEDGNVI